MHRLLLIALVALSACNAHQDAALEGDGPTSPVAAVEQAVEQAQLAEVEAADAEQAGPEGEPPELPVDQPTPQLLYDQCKARLEGPEADGECSTDADCGTAGCSQEVCVAASKKAEIITTCEILPCFAAKDRCGCHEGRCTWTLKEHMEPALPRIPIRIEEQ
jgi:eight-cysteine-cluster-containing protein